MWQQQPPDDPLAQRHLLLQQQYPQLQHQLPPGRAGLYSNPGADPLGSVELRGGAVGGFNLGPPGAAVGGGPFGTQVPSGPGFGVQQQQLPGGQVGGAASGGYAGAGLDEPLTPRSMQDAVAAAGMEVRNNIGCWLVQPASSAGSACHADTKCLSFHSVKQLQWVCLGTLYVAFPFRFRETAL